MSSRTADRRCLPERSKSLVVIVVIFACNFEMKAGTAATLIVLRSATAVGTVAIEINEEYVSREEYRSHDVVLALK